jgi:hypothetical protein
MGGLRDPGAHPEGRLIMDNVIEDGHGGARRVVAVLPGYRADGAAVRGPTDLALGADGPALCRTQGLAGHSAGVSHPTMGRTSVVTSSAGVVADE